MNSIFPYKQKKIEFKKYFLFKDKNNYNTKK